MSSWIDDANMKIEQEAEYTIERLEELASRECIEYGYVFDTFREKLNKLYSV